jgi:DNA-binding NtrC family response regulator
MNNTDKEEIGSDRTNILIVGGGIGGNSLLDLLILDRTSNIIGIVDLNPDAIGILNAKNHGIRVSSTYQFFLEDPKIHIDIIIDVSGNIKVYHDLLNNISADITLLGGKAAKFVWAFIKSDENNKVLKKKYNSLKDTLGEHQSEEMIYGANPLMLHVRDLIQQVAPTSSTVLIHGETGTGKEMVANSIHQLSDISNSAFVRINCTAFPPDLLDRELFGHVKGAFEGANDNKNGLLHMGDGGTIFLDEIGDIPLDMQAKVLRFLQFGEIRPIGSNETKIINARIITATNKDLETSLNNDKFRKDLFYRLNSFIIELPPLRNRKEDIPVLAYVFLNKAMAKLNKKVKSISSSAMERLNEYEYPGNIRELQSIIERAVILCNNNTIKPEHLPMIVQNSNEVYNYELGLSNARESVNDQFERQALQHYLIKTSGNVSKAALLAKTPRRTFYRLLEKHKLNKDYYKNIKS